MYLQRKKEWKTILGRVSCDPQEDVTRNGWRLLSFVIDDGKKEWPAKFMQAPDLEDGETLLSKKEKEGFCRDVTATFKGSWTGDELLVSQMFGIHVKGKKEVQNPGGRAVAAGAWKKRVASERGRGNVPCEGDDGRCFFHPISDCVSVNNRYYRKMDWIMEILGGEFVTKYLRKLGVTVSGTLDRPSSYARAKFELFERARAEELLRG